MYVPKLTHSERQERRKQIAKEVEAEGRTALAVTAACMRHRVTAYTVRAACEEAGVKIIARKRGVQAQPSAFKILAELLKGDLRQSEIADRLKVSRQYVSVIKKTAEDCGIVFPEKSDG